MIIFLHGEDTYRSLEKLQDIIEHYKKAHERAVHVEFFDCAQEDIEGARRAVETLSMFEKKKMLIFENLLSSGVFTAFLEERKENLEKSDRHIVVIRETNEIKQKAKNSPYQWLKKHARSQEFLALSPANVQRWIEREFSVRGLKVSSKAAETLARIGEHDLWFLSREVAKIAAFKWSSKETSVKEADIAALSRANTQTDIFSTIDAIAQKNKKHAFALLYKHIRNGESAQYLFSMLAYQFRVIAQVRNMMDIGIPYGDMAKRAGLHPYVVRKSVSAARVFSSDQLAGAYRKLFSLDVATKTGRADAAGALDVFVAKL